jgi:Domain of unknown function (DUF1905)/Bacteriocin-protection, YdeI or OmpD-Associated
VKQQYKSRLLAHGPNGAWTFLTIPFSVERIFGSRAQVKVAGTMNGFAFRSSLMPLGDGTHRMAVSKVLQAGAKAGPGSKVTVTMDVDRKERIIAVPVELKRALARNKRAAKEFEALSYSHRKELADWVDGAKLTETRLRRAQKAVPHVLAKTHAV